MGHDLGLLLPGIRQLCLMGLVQASFGVVHRVWVGDNAILRRRTPRYTDTEDEDRAVQLDVRIENRSNRRRNRSDRIEACTPTYIRISCVCVFSISDFHMHVCTRVQVIDRIA